LRFIDCLAKSLAEAKNAGARAPSGAGADSNLFACQVGLALRRLVVWSVGCGVGSAVNKNNFLS
jgi:hypothetical protein